MKKMLVLAAFALLLLPTAARAQLGRGEFSVGYGWNPSTKWVSGYVPNWVQGVTKRSWGGISIDYSFRVIGGLGVGASVIYSSIDQKSASQGTLTTHYYSVMPFLKMRWLHLSYLSLYSRGGLGYIYSHSSKLNFTRDHNKLAWQFSPIGLEVGKKFAAYAEAGIGTAGTVIAGLRVHF